MFFNHRFGTLAKILPATLWYVSMNFPLNNCGSQGYNLLICSTFTDVCSSTLKMDATRSSVNFCLITYRHIPEDCVITTSNLITLYFIEHNSVPRPRELLSAF